MIRPLSHLEEVNLPEGFRTSGDRGSATWLEAYTADFKRRIIALLGYEFRKLSAPLAYQFVARVQATTAGGVAAIETE